MPRSSTLALLGLVASPATAFFLMPCWPITSQRVDPIVNPGQLSSHVHQIAGGNGFAPMMDYNATQAASCTTCFVKGDKSNYWIPGLYYQHQDGSFERVDQVGSASMYYFNEATRLGPGETMETFPKGLRMLAGDPDKRTAGTDAASLALNYKCLNYAGVPTDSKTFPTGNCPNGVRAEVTYPSCWDGKNLDSADHKSHMAYPTGTFESGACPSTHPHHMVTLKVEFIFDTNKFKDQWYGNSQPFVWSNGDSTGYGLHADYMMGWDHDLLQSAVEQCFDIYGVLANCAPFNGQLPATQDTFANPGTCKVNDFVDEDIGGVVKVLPGCNALQAGPGQAKKLANCKDSAALVGNWGGAVGSAVSSAAGGVVSSLLAPVLLSSTAAASTSASVPLAVVSSAPASSAPSPVWPKSSSSFSFNKGGIYAQNAAAVSSSSTTTEAAPATTSSTKHVNIITVTEMVTETEYFTALATETATAWNAWKRDIGDHVHKHQHRHIRPHHHQRR